MVEVKQFSKAWFKEIVAANEKIKDENPKLVLDFLLKDLHAYIAHLDAIDAKRGGAGHCSERKRLANSLNGAKGGWVKGRPRKPHADELQEPQKQ